MNPERYTIIIVPDDESGTRSYNISRKMIRILFTVGILCITGVIIFIAFYVPKIGEYDTIKVNYENLAAERSKVLELSQDLQRLKQMDGFIRKSLKNCPQMGPKFASIFLLFLCFFDVFSPLGAQGCPKAPPGPPLSSFKTYF